MGNLFYFTLLRFLALQFLLNSLHKTCADFQSETPTDSESNHFHFVELSSLQPASTCSPSATEEEFLKLVHHHGPCSPSKPNAPSVREILQRDQMRVQSRLNGLNPVPLQEDSDSYVVNVGLGTPKRNFTLVVDTGSSLLWTQCQPCKLGNIGGCYKQINPIFNPSKSSTYTNIPCTSHPCTLINSTSGYFSTCISSKCVYETAYVDGSQVAGYLAKERVSVGSHTFNDIIFGCSEFNNLSASGLDGIIGLGQDFVSFMEQTAQTYYKVFSYCLPSKASDIGFLNFGKAKRVTKSLKFTQLGEGYIIPLVGIKLGNTKLAIAFKKGSASIDSGAVISRLPYKDYVTLRKAYRKAMTHYKLVKPIEILDTCYDVGGHRPLKLPKISFLFAGGVVLDLPPYGVAIPFNSTIVCLPFAPYPGGEDAILFGSTQQKTLEIVYDVAGGKIGFGQGGCK
ncbi:Xylanase inhibitor, C-terminal [Sesbania bispinosa]|nr:Xylanase inhibitor, C-terminal [Sesbania bispinosa]